MNFSTVLIANRGEIALRLVRACQGLGLRAVAVYSDADREAPHVVAAETAVHIGPSEAAQSYLDGARIIAAAKQAGAQAVHPGLGFWPKMQVSRRPALMPVWSSLDRRRKTLR